MRKQLQQFILTGIVNTIFYYLIYISAIYIGLSYQLATLTASLIGMFFSFRTFGKFVFDNTNHQPVYRFVFSYTLLYFINISIITAMKSFTLNYYFSGFVAVIICALLSFILNKFYVFK